jgi:hypothetical protein
MGESAIVEIMVNQSTEIRGLKGNFRFVPRYTRNRDTGDRMIRRDQKRLIGSLVLI